MPIMLEYDAGQLTTTPQKYILLGVGGDVLKNISRISQRKLIITGTILYRMAQKSVIAKHSLLISGNIQI
jgi:hypothetical protein